MIILENVCRSYRTNTGVHKVLDNVSVSFKEGVNTAILGLNGAGKSTMIRLIGGSEQPDSGRIIRDATVSWPIGFAGCFHGSLSGRENLRFVCRIYGANIKQVTAYVEEFSELGEYLDMPFKTYSSGMRSKLAFGLSLAVGFDFYLIDEAFSVGDVVFKRKAAVELNKLKERATLIYVSHSASSVIQHCSAGAVLNLGKLEYYSDIKQAIEKYTEICNARK